MNANGALCKELIDTNFIVDREFITRLSTVVELSS